MKEQKTLLKQLCIDKRFKIFIYQGELSTFDIRVKYRIRKRTPKQIHWGRERTPKHIHWVVDILLKKEHNTALTNQLIGKMLEVWDKTPHTQTKKQQKNSLTINNLWTSKQTEWECYKSLDSYGEYSSKFIIILLQLLMLQERANNKDAFFFTKLLKALEKDNNLWEIISIATHNGR